MQRRFPLGWTIFALSLVSLVWVYTRAFPIETAKMQQVDRALDCPSDLQLRLTVQYDKPPIYLEEWTMRNKNGTSTSSYRIRGYAGKQITITSPDSKTYDVSFMFGRVVQDGIWELVNQPPRGDTNAHYTLYIRQTASIQRGEGKAAKTVCGTGDRTITFTDPHYWATTAGRQFQIDLGKGAPKTANDLLKLNSTTLADPRYEVVVNDFRTFGPASFRSKIAVARATIRGGK